MFSLFNSFQFLKFSMFKLHCLKKKDFYASSCGATCENYIAQFIDYLAYLWLLIFQCFFQQLDDWVFEQCIQNLVFDEKKKGNERWAMKDKSVLERFTKQIMLKCFPQNYQNGIRNILEYYIGIVTQFYYYAPPVSQPTSDIQRNNTKHCAVTVWCRHLSSAWILAHCFRVGTTINQLSRFE